MYVYKTIGEFAGFIIAWCMVLEYMIASALAAKSLADYVEVISNRTILTMLRVETSFMQSMPGFESKSMDIPSVIIIILVGCILILHLKVSDLLVIIIAR